MPRQINRDADFTWSAPALHETGRANGGEDTLLPVVTRLAGQFPI